jgi:hypothetical protein
MPDYTASPPPVADTTNGYYTTAVMPDAETATPVLVTASSFTIGFTSYYRDIV